MSELRKIALRRYQCNVYERAESTGDSDTQLDLGRVPVRFVADRAGIHLPP